MNITAKISKRSNILLWLVILAALALRLYSVAGSLPYTFWHDENNYIETALRYGTGNFKMASYSHGGAFQVVLFFEYAAFYIILKLAGAIRTPVDFLARYLADPSAFFVIARLTVVLCSAGAVYLSYAICAKLFNREAGLVSGVFAAFSLLMVQVSSLALADMPCVFLLLLAVLMLICSIDKPEGRLLFYCACFIIGLSAACKYYAIFGIAPACVTAYIKHRRSKKKSFSFLLGLLFFGSIIVFAGLLAGIPSLVFSLKELYRDTFIRMGSEFLIKNQPGEAWFISLACHMRNGLGIPLAITVFFGILFSLCKHTEEDVLLLSFPAAYYLLFMRSGGYAYHLLPAVPFILILAARFIDTVVKKIFANGSYFACIIASLLLTAPTFVDSVKFVNIMSGRDTRIEAKAWTDGNIPQDSSVLSEGYIAAMPVFAPPLAGNRETLERDLEYAVASGGGFLTKIKIKYYDRIYGSRKGYDVYKVYRLRKESAEKAGSSYIFLTETGDAGMVAASVNLSAKDYLTERKQLDRYLSEAYETEKAFVPTRVFSMMFPHLAGFDYKLIRDISLGESCGFVNGPKIGIYRKK